MNRGKRLATSLFAAALTVGALAPSGAAQDVPARPRRSAPIADQAYQVGFDAGYRSGYKRGIDDFDDSNKRDVDRFAEYRSGDSGYVSSAGTKEEYRNGFRGGFSVGYDDGVNGRAYGARPGERSVPDASDGPAVLKRSDPNDAASVDDPNDVDVVDAAVSTVPSDVSFVVVLDSPISSSLNKDGDRFSATVADGDQFAGARVDGHIGRVVESGRVKGRAELVLVFDRITFADGTSERLVAQVEEIVGYGANAPKQARGKAPWDWGKARDKTEAIDATVDDEGRIEANDTKKDDAVKVGTGAVAGAIIGGILGGGGGAAAGAAVGGAAGGGAVVASKGKQIELDPGCQLRIRTGKAARL